MKIAILFGGNEVSPALVYLQQNSLVKSIAFKGQKNLITLNPRATLNDELAPGWYRLPPRGKYPH